jgi:type IV secretory pathway component VirB8
MYAIDMATLKNVTFLVRNLPQAGLQVSVLLSKKKSSAHSALMVVVVLAVLVLVVLAVLVPLPAEEIELITCAS